MPLRRIAFACLAGLAAALAALPASAEDEIPWRHALSLIDTPKYPADFKHFDYVNPDAPKGGLVRLSSTGSFDSLNPVLATKGNPAPGIGFAFETLMTPSLDESSTEYGLLAEAVRFPADYSWVTYRLRDKARWQDGQPLTADDVIWSFEVQKKPEINPNVAAYYSHVTKVEKTGDRDITFTFDAPGNRELPQIIGQLTVLPKHYWEGTDAKGRQRNIGDTTLEPPLGSGPYSQVGRSRARHQFRARARLLGQGSAGQCRLEQFRRNPLHDSARPDGRVAGLQRRPVRLARRELVEGLGDRLRFSGAQGRPRRSPKRSPIRTAA